MKKLLLALQFLTIIPVRVRGDISEKEIAGAAIFFPVVGAVQGLILLLSALLLAGIFPVDIVSGIVIAIAVIGSGGFHLDGVADTFDALAVKSSGNVEADREKRLEVMKDSLTGAMGVTAITVVLLLKFLLIKNLLSSPVPLTALLILFLMPVFSRWIMVPAMYHGNSARSDGLGKIFIHGASGKIVILSLVFAFLLFSAVVGAHMLKYYGAGSLLFFAMLPAGYLIAAGCAGFGAKKFGGLTGDTFGAISELSEIFYLIGAYIWLQHFI